MGQTKTGRSRLDEVAFLDKAMVTLANICDR